MKEEHHEIRAPKKEQLPVSSNRKSKSINAPSKKLHQQQKSIKTHAISDVAQITDGDVVLNLSEKQSIEEISSISEPIDADQSTADISNTNLNSYQILVSDDTLALKLPENSARISPISEAFVFYDDQSSLESYFASLNQHISPSSITPSSLEATPLSSITTAEMTPSSSTSTSAITADAAALHGTTIKETKSVKLESLVKHLRESMLQVLHSSDIDPDYKKLLDAWVKTSIEQFCSSHEETGFIVGMFSKKEKLGLLSYLVVMLLGTAGFFLLSDIQNCYHGPPPT